MNLHRFTDTGLSRFSAYLDSLTTPVPAPFPNKILHDPSCSELVSTNVDITPRAFASRRDLAGYLNSRFTAGEYRPSLKDKHLWAWLACLLFMDLCPKDRFGALVPGARQRWIPDPTDFRRYYRHLLMGPYGILEAHLDEPERAMAVLCQPPGRPGDVVEQLASRQEVVTSPTLMKVATKLFYDSTTGKLRRGAGGKGAGSARRLIDVLNQFDVTWDLTALPAPDLLAMLPAEFGHRSRTDSLSAG